MLDYRNLLFISSQSPYFELFRASGSRAPGEGMPGSDVDVAIYGWGLHPIYSSARIAWPIDESLFQRLYTKDRAPFWADIERSDGKYPRLLLERPLLHLRHRLSGVDRASITWCTSQS